ncbi:hypothetical protein DL93DRAFT_1412722 [Clavulina sp. PMI_390]|nr:hypothetical protein DL93DRAFT_1412722 [Clavulina sp. PMI_390]
MMRLPPFIPSAQPQIDSERIIMQGMFHKASSHIHSQQDAFSIATPQEQPQNAPSSQGPYAQKMALILTL